MNRPRVGDRRGLELPFPQPDTPQEKKNVSTVYESTGQGAMFGVSKEEPLQPKLSRAEREWKALEADGTARWYEKDEKTGRPILKEKVKKEDKSWVVESARRKEWQEANRAGVDPDKYNEE